MKGSRKRGQAGFTLIELLVVMAILAVLVGLAIPRVREVIDQSKRTRAQADLKVIAGALERYFTDNGHYPDTLDELRTKKYVKFDMSFKNASDKYYFYAINDSTGNKATAYVLMDPGGSPASGNIVNLDKTEQGKPVPEGQLPTNKAFAWVTANAGDPTVTFKYGGANVTDSSVGAYCAQGGRTCRADMVTD